MTEAELIKLHALAQQAARQAGDEIAAIKHPMITKKPDGSVLTSADLRANEIICSTLAASKLPICSEEALLPFSQRDGKDFWLVDPLDGSANYAKNRSSYAVCIALISDRRPVVAVIYDVCGKKLYSAYKGSGVWKNAERIQPCERASYRALISMRTNSHPLNDQFIIDHDYEPLMLGSALKFCALLDGRADIYARFDCLNSWDIAAGDLLINEAGGIMLGLNHKELDYGRADFSCMPFIALAAYV